MITPRSVISARYRAKHRLAINARKRERYALNPAVEVERHHLYYLENAERIGVRNRNYQKAHRAEQRERSRLKRQTSPQYRFSQNLRKRVWDALRANCYSAFSEALIGCDRLTLRASIEAQFKPGMNWSNYGKEWQIDHKIPCIEFDLMDALQQRRCFHYTNLQPLWAMENFKKGPKRASNFPADAPTGIESELTEAEAGLDQLEQTA